MATGVIVPNCVSGPYDEHALLLSRVADHRDREAFSALFRWYAPRIKRHLVARGASTGIADDMAQEVMMRVWRKAALFDANRAPASAWIFAITRSCFVDGLRRQRRAEVDPFDALLEDQQCVHATLDHIADRRDLELALSALPPEQAAVLRSAYFDGQSMSQISSSTGQPLGTVKTRARLGLSRMREIIGARRPK